MVLLPPNLRKFKNSSMTREGSLQCVAPYINPHSPYSHPCLPTSLLRYPGCFSAQTKISSLNIHQGGDLLRRLSFSPYVVEPKGNKSLGLRPNLNFLDSDEVSGVLSFQTTRDMKMSSLHSKAQRKASCPSDIPLKSSFLSKLAKSWPPPCRALPLGCI